MSPEAALKFKMTSPAQSKYADPKYGILSSIHNNVNTNTHKSRIKHLSNTIDANSRALEDKLPKMLSKQRQWDHPLYDDSKGGMTQSPSNGILAIFEANEIRAQGSKFNTRQAELVNMQQSKQRVNLEQFERQHNLDAEKALVQ